MAIETNPTVPEVLEHAKRVALAQAELRQVMADVSAEVAAGRLASPPVPAQAP